MSNRRIEDLSPEMQAAYYPFAEEVKAEGIDILITCTRRSQLEQDALFEQGRTKPGLVVTWTHNSKHLTGDAIDFVVMVNGKPDWVMRYRNQWDKVVEIGKKHGMTQVIGKDGRVKEFAHLQINRGA